jgi:ribonuclease HII
MEYTTVIGGDNTYCSIAAASILAKWYRDQYIAELCETYPELIERYNLDSNKGYGTKQHINGIKQHGITQWHRRSFGICNTSTFNPC